MSEPEASMLRQVILGHIEVRELIGAGAMGRVYRAFQKGVDRDVAVKVLHRELSVNEQIVARFLREAKVASRLSHPHVVQVHLSGQLPDGQLYMVMEYLPGRSLQRALAEAGGAFDTRRALHVALQVADAIGEAHALGIVHRDLKPENIMLVPRTGDGDFVKVLDFGIARVLDAEPTVATSEGQVFGTPRYISPEAAKGERVGPAADVYALSTILYQMLAGRTPFGGEQAVPILLSQVHDAPPPLSRVERAHAVPAPVERVVMRGLAKGPSERYGDGRAFARALYESARESGLSAEDLGVRPSIVGSEPHGDPAPKSVPVPGIEPTLDDTTAMAAVSSGTGGETRGVAKTEVPVAADAGVVQQFLAMPPADVRAGPTGTELPSDEPALPPDARAAPSARRGAPLWVLGGAVLVVAALVAGYFAYERGAFQPSTVGPTVDSVVVRAREAISARRWDTPSHDNVRDITREGLLRWPDEPRLREVRSQAARELVTVGIEQHEAGEYAEAVRLLELATEFDKGDGTASRLLEKYRADYQESLRVAPLASQVPQAGELQPAPSMAELRSAPPVRPGRTAPARGTQGRGAPADGEGVRAAPGAVPSAAVAPSSPGVHHRPPPAPSSAASPTPSARWL